MSSKFGLAGGIPERRVRPVWDAIDSRQFKNALKLASSLLSKHPNSPYALALKALVLERMGKTDEALSVCLNAKELLYKDDSLLMDDLTLSTLQIVFQSLGHLDLATSCYEHACVKFPNNLELMMGLFNCYVREYSFVKQQQTAIKMYKLAGEERFLLWAVCSIQLQVLCENGGEKLLLLAEGLLKKHIASHSLHEPEALMVFISVLERQSKYNDALEVLSGNLGSLLMIEVDKLRIQGRLLARAGDFTAAADIYKKILELSPDDWECFLHYLGCLLEDDSLWTYSDSNNQVHPVKFVECKFSLCTDEMFDSRTSSALDFVQKLQADTSDDNIRGPFLAKLEIERRMFLYGKKNENNLTEALLEYFLKFGHLACFASDIELFLQVLSPDKKAEFVEQLVKSSESLSVSLTKVIGRTLTISKVQELTGNTYKLAVGELLGSAVKIANLYCQTLPLSKDLDPQENMYGEELLTVVCNMLVQFFCRTRHFGYLIEAIMVLEFGLTVRRYVSQYKILLLHLYSHIGALPLAYEWYKALDVKNILTETVSHHILPQMLESPMWIDLKNLLKDYLKFMDDYLGESADLTFLAYRHRNYSKVIEFVQFKERLQRSNQYLVARVEAPILQLKQNAENIEEEERILETLNGGVHFVELSNEIGSKLLTFNEDLQTRPWWTPTPDKNYLLGPFEGISYFPKEKLVKEREESVQRAIQRKSLVPRMIYLSIQSASTAFMESIEANGSMYDPTISAELKILLERYAKTLGFSLSNAIELISEVSSDLKTFEALDSDIVDWLNFAVFWNSWSLNTHQLEQPDRKKSGHSSWQIVNFLLEKYILDKIRSTDTVFGSLQSNLPTIVKLVTEPLAWQSLIIQACVRSSFPSGKKKKKSVQFDQSSSPLSQAVKDSAKHLCSIVQEVAKWLSNQINQSEDEYAETIISSLKRKDEEGGPGQVLEILETLVSHGDESELGHQISQALKSWNSVDIARKIVTGQRKVLSEFLRICESKIKLLEGLKQKTSHV